MLRRIGVSRRHFLSLSAVLLASCGGGGSSGDGASVPEIAQPPSTPTAPTLPQVQKGAILAPNEYETAMVVFNGEPLAITFVHPWSATVYEATMIRVRRYLTGEVLAEKPWTGGMGCAIVKDGAIHIFGNTNWQNPGNKLIHSVLAADFTPSAPVDALLMNAPNNPFRFYNSDVTADANGFRMVIETSVGVYFARSTDLDTWTWGGGQLKAGEYCGCPSIDYINGAHFLTFLAQGPNGTYETRTAKSQDDCFTFSYLQALLTPDAGDGTNCSDVDMVEVAGRVLGVYLDGDQVTHADLRKWTFDGTLAQMFSALT